MTHTFPQKISVALVRAPYRKDIIGLLEDGIREELAKIECDIEVYDVHGSFEIPAMIALLEKSDKQIDAYVTVGCILKGDTIHDEVISYPVYHKLIEMQTNHTLCIGNAILTVNTEDQAFDRADKARQNRGAEAAKAALGLLQHKYNLGLVR